MSALTTLRAFAVSRYADLAASWPRIMLARALLPGAVPLEADLSPLESSLSRWRYIGPVRYALIPDVQKECLGFFNTTESGSEHTVKSCELAYICTHSDYRCGTEWFSNARGI